MNTQRLLILGLTLTAAACPGDDSTTLDITTDGATFGTTGTAGDTSTDPPTGTTPTTDGPTSTGPTSTTAVDPDTTTTTVDPDTTLTTLETTTPLTDTSDTGDTSTGTSTGDTSDTSTGDDTTTTGDTMGDLDDEIYDIQNGTIATGEAVVVKGVVVTAIATTKSGFMVQEQDGGQYSGAWVFVGAMGPDISMLAVGDEVDITGKTAEFNQLTEIDASAGSVVETGVSGVVIEPHVLPIASVGDPVLAEPWEGVHVVLNGAPLTVSALLAGEEFQVTAGAVATIDNLGYSIIAKPEFPSFGVGASFTSIAGPLNSSGNVFKVLPRSPADFVGYMPANNPMMGVDALKAGDLVVTEVMYNPTCNNDDCEWIEVLNTTATPIDLMGLVIQDDAQNANAQGKITVSTVIMPGQYVVLGYKTMATWPYPNPPAAFYGANPAFGNGVNGDQVFLKNATLTIDSTAKYLGQAGKDSGKSWKLDPTKQNAVDNDVADNWCYSSAVFYMTEQGSPTALNEAPCAVL